MSRHICVIVACFIFLLCVSAGCVVDAEVKDPIVGIWKSVETGSTVLMSIGLDMENTTLTFEEDGTGVLLTSGYGSDFTKEISWAKSEDNTYEISGLQMPVSGFVVSDDGKYIKFSIMTLFERVSQK